MPKEIRFVGNELREYEVPAERVERWRQAERRATTTALVSFVSLAVIAGATFERWAAKLLSRIAGPEVGALIGIAISFGALWLIFTWLGPTVRRAQASADIAHFEATGHWPK